VARVQRIGEGRAPPDPELVARALQLAAKVGVREAAEILAKERPDKPVSGSTIYAWRQGKNGAAPVKEVLARVAAREGTARLKEVGLVVSERVVPLTGQRLERAENLRRMVSAGDVAADTIDRLAVTWKCSAEDVKLALLDAATLSPGLALPKGLALEESRATARRVRKMAEDAADGKTVLAAQKHLDGLAGLDPKAQGAVPTDHVARAEVVVLLRRIDKKLSDWPEAQSVFRAEVAAAG
jgi:hypothetical protein